jgi:hypothetical protein
MNPVLQAALGSILRWAFTLGAGYLIRAGIWQQQDAETYVAALTLALLTLAWSLWAKYRSRVKLLTALQMPKGSTENDMNDCVKRGETPPILTKASEVPVAVAVEPK